MTPFDYYVVEKTAPWWIPEEMKLSITQKWGSEALDEVWGTVCGDRKRTAVAWSDGKLTISSQNADKTPLVEKNNLSGAVFHPDNINLLVKRGKMEVLPTPWSA